MALPAAAHADMFPRLRSRIVEAQQVNYHGRTLNAAEFYFVDLGKGAFVLHVLPDQEISSKRPRWTDSSRHPKFSHEPISLVVHAPGQAPLSTSLPSHSINCLIVDIGPSLDVRHAADLATVLDVLFIHKVIGLLIAFWFTLAIELAVIIAWSQTLKAPLTRPILACVLGNLLSLPLLWGVMAWSMLADDSGHWEIFLGGEAVVWLFEACLLIYIGRVAKMRAFGMAFVANLMSAVTGCLTVL